MIKKNSFDWNGFMLGFIMSLNFMLLGVIIVANILYPSFLLVLLYIFLGVWSIIYFKAVLIHQSNLAVKKYKEKLDQSDK